MLDEKERTEGEPLPYLANINVRWGAEFDLENLREMRFEHDVDGSLRNMKKR